MFGGAAAARARGGSIRRSRREDGWDNYASDSSDSDGNDFEQTPSDQARTTRIQGEREAAARVRAAQVRAAQEAAAGPPPPQIANAAKGAVADARMRGGGYSKALVGA